MVHSNIQKCLGLMVVYLLAVLPFGAHAEVKKYFLDIKPTEVNFTGKKATAWTINGEFPGTQLRYKKGDIAEITVKNSLPEETTLHWHGLLVPPNMDGPAPSNNEPIHPGKSFTYKFPIKHTGTFWYHSHSGLQEQRGVFGPIVIEDENPDVFPDHDVVLVLSDWTDENPKKVLRNLRKDGDYYSFKKNFFPSVVDAIQKGQFWDYVKNEWMQMGQMDIADVAYGAFLINGKTASAPDRLSDAKPGDLVRMRIINAAASTHFYMNIGKNRVFQVFSKDGNLVEETDAKELLIGMAETYDVLLTVPADGPGAFEVAATPMDVTGRASFVVGAGNAIERTPLRMKPSPYRMEGHGGGHHGGHGGGDPNRVMPLDPHTLRALKPTRMSGNKIQEIKLTLDGHMEKYYWTINGKMISEETFIEINNGDLIRFAYDNRTMMRHPMHLHGHFFRVVGLDQGDYSPLIHTIDIAPFEKRTIEFVANEPGLWALHCHNLYHMEMGMMRFVRYKKLPHSQQHLSHMFDMMGKMHADSQTYWTGGFEFEGTDSRVNIRADRGRYEFRVEMEMEKFDSRTFEADAIFRKHLNQLLSVAAGVEYLDNRELSAIFGFEYLLPLMVKIEAHVNHRGGVTVRLTKELPIAQRWRLKSSVENSPTRKLEAVFRLLYRLNADSDLGIFMRSSLGNRPVFGIFWGKRF